MKKVVSLNDYRQHRRPNPEPSNAIKIIRKKTKDKQTVVTNNLTGIVSSFEKIITKERKKLKKKNQSLTDSKSSKVVLESLLEMTLEMIPIAEKAYRKYTNQTNAYAANALISQSREIMNEIRSMSDNSATTEHIMNSILLPALKLILQHLLNSFTNLKKDMLASLPKKRRAKMRKYLNNLLKSHGQLLEEISASIDTQIRTYFA